jgi:molybdopterin-guanine dinucleotide biosynthesis protein A
MFSVIIQAGGKSSRMGSNKALLPLCGRPLIAHVTDRFSSNTDDLIIISPRNTELETFGYSVYEDISPGIGPLMGLYTGLYYSKHDTVAVVACDMPFASFVLIQEEARLLANLKYDVVIPVINGKSEPLHAVYSRTTCLRAIENGLTHGIQRLIDWHSEVKVYEMGEVEINRFDPSGLAFFNINTPEDLKRAEEIINE